MRGKSQAPPSSGTGSLAPLRPSRKAEDIKAPTQPGRGHRPPVPAAEFSHSPVPGPAPKPGPTPALWLRTPSPGATDSCPSGRGQEMVFRPLIPANSREPGTFRPCQLGPQGSREGGPGGGGPHCPSLGYEPQLLTPLLPTGWGLGSPPRGLGLPPPSLGLGLCKTNPAPPQHCPGVQRPTAPA